MSPHEYTLLTAIHGLLSALGLALLAHPTFRAVKRPLLSTELRLVRWAALSLTVPIFLGFVAYPVYRGRVKPTLWAGARHLAEAFEVKEHFAAFVLYLVLGAAALTFVRMEASVARPLFVSLLVPAWVLGVGTALLGLVVGGGAHPGWVP